MSRIAVIGAGISGLACALRLSERGHRVTIFERDDEPGGLAASSRVRGVAIDRAFHFICPPDAAYLQLIDDIGVADELHWQRTTMGVFRDGVAYRFGSPSALAAFSPLPIPDRVRFATATLHARLRTDWDDLDALTAREWLIAEQGPRCYEVIWRPLLEGKFGVDADEVSAAWMWARIDRVARSRNGVMGREHLGYLTGGTATVVEALIGRIESSGGDVRLDTPIEHLAIADGRVAGVRSSHGDEAFDAVVSTVAPPLLTRIAPGLPKDYREALDSIGYLGVVCWVVLAHVPLSPHFWLNVDDPRAPFPGVITYTQLDPMPTLGGLHVHYIPRYLGHPELEAAGSGAGMEAVVRGLDAIRPGFSEHIEEVRVFVRPWAQPIYVAGYARRFASLASPATPVAGLFRADMSQVYPHDRSLVNAAAHASVLAEALGPGPAGILP